MGDFNGFRAFFCGESEGDDGSGWSITKFLRSEETLSKKGTWARMADDLGRRFGRGFSYKLALPAEKALAEELEKSRLMIERKTR